jgi:hypothetical protein
MKKANVFLKIIYKIYLNILNKLDAISESGDIRGFSVTRTVSDVPPRGGVLLRRPWEREADQLTG